MNKISAKARLIELQKETFARLKQEVLESRKGEDTSIGHYREVYLYQVQDYERYSSKNELFQSLKKASICYCGDFHTLRRSQYTACKLIDFVSEFYPRVYLALEMIPEIYEGLANEYVQGKYSEEQFLTLIRYHELWGFPWEHYRMLFDVAKQHQNIEIVGLNTNDGGYQSLAKRDQLAADRIANCIEKDPKAHIFCLYGDLHVAPEHIPYRVERECKKRNLELPPHLTVYQNSDQIYWKLVEEDQAHQVDVVRVHPDAFCVLNSTPWVKWQSYQSWLEDQSDILDALDQGEENFGFEDSADLSEELRVISMTIAKFLTLDVPDLDNFAVYTAFDSELIENIDEYILELSLVKSPDAKDLLHAEMVENRSLFFTKSDAIYLLDPSETRATEKATQLLSSKLTRNLAIYAPHFDRREIFYRIAIWEAIGYFGSKITNPKRKCSQYRDLEKKLECSKGKKLLGIAKEEKIIAKELLKHREYEHERIQSKKKPSSARKLYRLKPSLFYLAARTLGRMMGDRLYRQVVKDLVPMELIRRMFTCLSENESGEHAYWELSQALQYDQMNPFMSKDDRF
ncbi:MAG: ChaN family lipoprotein [Bdellovibrionales bacterium]|nr:ChaN family lipoprotein [Bdellovibrionales bacterium]